jgi:hypothetical protein
MHVGLMHDRISKDCRFISSADSVDMLRRLLLAQRGVFPARTPTTGLRRRNISTSIFGYTISGTPKAAQQTRQAGGGRDGFFNGAGEGFGLGLAILLSVHIFYDHGYSWTGTWGPSMLPTLNASGTSVVVSKWYRRGRGIQVGDIVSYKHPVNGDMTTIKRVIGMPGDFVLRDTPGKGDGTMIQVRIRFRPTCRRLC